MQYTDKKRIAAVVAGWGALGVFITRVTNFVDWMKRPEALTRLRDFLRRHGVCGVAVLAAYTDVNPFGVALGTDTSDAYVDYAEQFMNLWESPTHARIGGHGRVCVLVYESFAAFGHDEHVYIHHVGDIANKIWWQRAFSDSWSRKEA